MVDAVEVFESIFYVVGEGVGAVGSGVLDADFGGFEGEGFGDLGGVQLSTSAHPRTSEPPPPGT